MGLGDDREAFSEPIVREAGFSCQFLDSHSTRHDETSRRIDRLFPIDRASESAGRCHFARTPDMLPMNMDVISLNRVRSNNVGMSKPVAELIIGDHLEALNLAMDQRGAQLSSYDRIRQRSAAGGTLLKTSIIIRHITASSF